MSARRPFLVRCVLAGLVVALVGAGPVAAAPPDEVALAGKFAPVVRLVAQAEACGPGEPYLPSDVDILFDEPTVALRGPWSPTDLVAIGPGADELVARYEYHLDFPGHALAPGCEYEKWARHITGKSRPAVYAHVATDPGQPGKLALQYWFFYVFNDFNNKHEGDWEMIQLDFDAGSVAEALRETPTEVGFSSHEGAERAEWGADKLDLVDGTHPVVYPAAGSHANKYTAALYLGSSAEAGVGCDDTRAPHLELLPVVKTIPADRAAAEVEYPWLAFQGRWGELQPAFYNGPTGPNLKRQWTEPFAWAEHSWRDRSFAVPTGGIVGTSATDLFCGGVAAGSNTLIRLVENPGPTLLALAGLLALVVWVVVKMTWTPVAPLRVARRRGAGQVISSSARMYVAHWRLFLGIGLILVPLGLLITFLQWGLFRLFDLAGSVTGSLAGGLASSAVALGAALSLLGLGLVQAATVCALAELDLGRTPSAIGAYRIALRRVGPLLRSLVIVAVVWTCLAATAVLLPVALWLVVRWCFVAPVIELEGLSTVAALRRSGRLVSRRWLHTAALVGAGGAFAFALGPVVGVIMIFLTDAPLELLNVVAGCVYALAMPLVALVAGYAYFDARVRVELEPAPPSELPAEIRLPAS
ncbi:MAG: hypothetical protein U0R50_11055 [Gaiellales bacterium]